MIQQELRFDGSDIDDQRDTERLSGQLKSIFEVMKQGEWLTLSEISRLTHAPEASVSAQLRNLRKPRFGGYTIEKKHHFNGLYSYKMSL